MKTVLIVPPHWFPMSLHLAVPLLVGQLQAAGFDSKGFDFNVEFLNYILTKDYVSKSIDRINSFLHSFENGDFDNKNETLKKQYGDIKLFVQKNGKYFNEILENIKDSVQVYRNKEDFYNPKKFHKANVILKKAFKIISYSYYPANISLQLYNQNNYNYNFEDILNFSNDIESNMFISFYEKQIETKLLDKEIKFIGISMTGLSQFLPALTLARMLKKRTNAKIILGGNYLTRIINEIKKYPAFFDEFCDICSLGEGKQSIVEIAKYIDNQIPFEEVSGILYKNPENEIVENKKKSYKNLDEVANISLEGYDLNKYFIPEAVFPMQARTGCYWGKCTFCSIDYGKKHCIKSINKLIDEIKFVKEKYGVTKFDFIDEAIAPAYLEEFADRLINENLNINYYISARFEKAFTKKLFQKAKKSGLVLIAWGYESSSERVLKLMKKGGDYNHRLRILKEAADVGIWNHVFVMFGFPTETKEEAQKTQNDINNNFDIIHSIDFGRFILESDKIIRNPEQYHLKNIIKNKDNPLSILHNYECSIGMNGEEVNGILDSQFKIEKKLNYVYRYLCLAGKFLYAIRYGTKKTKKMKFK